jgi:hypothetical protein
MRLNITEVNTTTNEGGSHITEVNATTDNGFNRTETSMFNPVAGSSTGKESFRMHFFHGQSILQVSFGQHLPTRCYNISPEHVLSPSKN